MLDTLRNLVVIAIFLAAPVLAISAFDTYQTAAAWLVPAQAQTWPVQAILLVGALWNAVICVVLAKDILR